MTDQTACVPRRAAATAACLALLACGCARGPAPADDARVAALGRPTLFGPQAACGATTAAGAARRDAALSRALWQRCGSAAQGSRHACVHALMLACG